MDNIPISRPLRCIDKATGQTVFDVMNRSVDYEGGRLVSLVNVASEPREVYFELNGKQVETVVDLFKNEERKADAINIEPLEVILLQIP